MMDVSKRNWMTAAGMATCAAWFGLCPRAEAQESVPKAVQPDILLIMPDQMRGDCLSLLGHPVVRTPHLDQLAAQGTVFTRAYTTCPSCIPARYALLTGLYPQTSGVVGFANKPVDVPTLPALLTEAGYSTLLVGRYMHQKPQNNGYQQQILGSTYVAGDDYDNYLKQAAPDSGGIRKLVTSKLRISYNSASAKPWPLAEELHPSVWIVRESCKAVEAAEPDRPLFLTASFYAPHPPLFPPARYFEAVKQRQLPEPAHGDWEEWSALSPAGNKAGNKAGVRILLQGALLRDVLCGYFGLIEQLDDQLVTLVDAFKERSRKAGRPWVIVFCSDHGEMLGDHGYFRKCEPYEGSARIPLIIAGSPELGFRAGQRMAQPVCLEDILPTLLDLAQGQRPARLDGISLIPALRGDTQKIRPWVHLEHSPYYSREQAFHALTDGRFKYIWRPVSGAEQLFDLENDPQENHDLARDAQAAPLLNEWRARMVQQLAGRPEGFSDGKKLIAGRPYPAIQKKP